MFTLCQTKVNRSIRTGRPEHAALVCQDLQRNANIEQLEPRRLFSSAYSLTDLGSLAGYQDFTATALNATGQVVGFAGQADPYYSINDARAFAYRGGQIQAIAARGSIATGINDRGQVIGALADQGSLRPFFTDAATGAVTDFSNAITTPTPGWDQLHLPHAINNAGQIAGETIYAYGGDQSGWVYTPAKSGNGQGSLTGVVDNESNNAALAINNSGVAAGYAGSLLYGHAFQLADGRAIGLHTLSGPASPFASSRARGMNDAGQIVGESSVGPDGITIHAFLHTGGAMRDLGVLPGQFDSTAADVNDQGIVCGQSGGRAFVFQDGKMTDLNALVPDVKGLVLSDAVAINDNGQIAVNGTINGHARAFLLTPTGITGIVTGRVFEDRNGDGVRQPAEPLLAKRQVYVDANRNGRYDAGEQTTFTSAAGRYRLSGLAAGTCRIAQVSPKGWRATAGAGSATVAARTSADVTVSFARTLINKDFGSRRI